jgi:hypothetical protein
MKYQDIEEFKKDQGYIIENVWYPRVTKICDVKSKPALYYFYAQSPDFETANLKKRKAADEGKIVHEIIESFITRRSIIVPEEYLGFKKAFEDFLKNHSFFSKFEWIEKKVRHPAYRYVGTFDAVGEIDGYFSLIDIKTSQSVYEDYRLQTAAYFYAINEEPWLLDYKGIKTILPREIEKRYILRLNQKRICQKCGAVLKVRQMGDKLEKEDNSCNHEFGDIVGEWELKEFDNPEEDFKGFLHCKGLWEWENRDFLKEIGYL